MSAKRIQRLQAKLESATEKFEQCMEVASMSEPDIPTDELVGIIDQVQALDEWLRAAEPYIGRTLTSKIRHIMDATEDETVTLSELISLEELVIEAVEIVEKKSEQLEEMLEQAQIDLDEALED
jgi:hypothetical protein